MKKITYATTDQITTIKRLHEETGNLKAAARPYTRMRYESAVKEIAMLNDKMSALAMGIKPKKTFIKQKTMTKRKRLKKNCQ